MRRKTSAPKKGTRSRARRVVCEDVRFAEVEFPRPVRPRLVIEFSGGLSLLVEDRQAIDLAGEFIAAFRAHEHRLSRDNRSKGGDR